MRTDRAYEYDINQLIPTAEKEARVLVALSGVRSIKRSGKDGFYNHCMFTDYFHKTMKRLAVEAGLRRF